MENTSLLANVALVAVESAIQNNELKGVKLRSVQGILGKHKDIRFPTLYPANFQLISLLGEGGYATCVMAKIKSSGLLVAIKSSTSLETARYEKEIMTMLDHKSILKVLGSFMFTCTAFIVTELALEGSLNEHLVAMTEKDVAKMALQMLSALGHLRNMKIVHRDIKPENILIRDQTFKLCDFNIAIKFDLLPYNDGHWHGTYGYYAPETLAKCDYTPETDLFSLGIVIWEAQTNTIMFSLTRRTLSVRAQNVYASTVTEENISKFMVAVKDTPLEEILRVLLDFEPNKRNNNLAVENLTKFDGSTDLYDGTVRRNYRVPNRVPPPITFFDPTQPSQTTKKSVVFWNELLALDFYYINDMLKPENEQKRLQEKLETTVMSQADRIKTLETQLANKETPAGPSHADKLANPPSISNLPQPNLRGRSTKGADKEKPSEHTDSDSPQKKRVHKVDPKVGKKKWQKIISSSSEETEMPEMKKAKTQKKARKITSSSSEEENKKKKAPVVPSSSSSSSEHEIKNKKPFRCHKCKGRFATKHNLHRHLLNLHGKGQTFKCTVRGCGRTFKRNENLSEHLTRDHGGKAKHKCKICRKRSFTRAEVFYHQKSCLLSYSAPDSG